MTLLYFQVYFHLYMMNNKTALPQECYIEYPFSYDSRKLARISICFTYFIYRIFIYLETLS